MELTMEAAGQEIDGEGAFDLEAGTGTLSLEFPAPVDASLVTVFDGTTFYMDSGFLRTLGAPVDADWIRYDLDEMAELSDTGIDVSELTSGANDPTDVLGGLEAIADGAIEELGTEEIRGVETTGYAAEIDMAAALDQLEEQTGGESLVDEEQAEAFLASFGDDPIETEVWIDGEGLVRRQVVEMRIGGEEMTQTMEFFDFGEPVDVTVPDDADAVSIVDLLGDLGTI
jgi:hypothetical protein